MNMIFHNLKVAIRNLMKYKLQTLISILSIAIGIVTISLAHSILIGFRLPEIYNEPYYDRSFKIRFETEDGEPKKIDNELLRLLTEAGGLKNAERIAVPSGFRDYLEAEFHLPDSTIRKGPIGASILDPEYPNFAGLRSAITGKKIRVLKRGEAILSEKLAKLLFQDKNPIGTVQNLTSENQPFPVTIVDVYRNLSINESPMQNDIFYYCVSDDIADDEMDAFHAGWINVEVKRGSNIRDLENEINQKVKPLGLTGLKAEISDIFDSADIISAVRTLVYIISSLILIAAIIGFLRLQIQLFWIRRRELSLRIVNGASLSKLFILLFSEVFITICLSVITAVILGFLMEDFINSSFSLLMEKLPFDIRNLWIYSLTIGGALLIICGVIVWLTLIRISKSGEGLGANMRRRRNHFFRNVMLGIQVAICSLFLCCTFILIRGGNEMLKAYNIPDNDNEIKNSTMLLLYASDHPDELLEAVRNLPSLKEMIMLSMGYYPIENVLDNPEAKDKLDGQTYFPFYFTNDTSFISFLRPDLEWFNKDIDRSRCLLVSKKLYSKLSRLGLLNDNSLTVSIHNKEQKRLLTLPIAGLINTLPYETEKLTSIAITPDLNASEESFVLVPKAGKSKSLAKDIDAVLQRLESESITPLSFNMRLRLSPESLLVSSARTGGYILGIISLIICAMSIFSSITLDTRTRKKEVAIRKVNGAKNYDIFRMFGKLYFILIIVTSVIVIPASVVFNIIISDIVKTMIPNITLSPVGPIILGLVVIILLISIIVACQIYRIMKSDPSKLIAKE